MLATMTTSKSRPSSGHVSGAREGQWPVSSCGWTEEVAGDWWAGFGAYGTLGACGVHLRLFQPHPCMFLILHFDVVSGPFGDNAYAN